MQPEEPPASTGFGPAAPPVIADYEMIRRVGRGAYGDVWLARGVTGVFRAIKIVWRERFADAQPFEREFRGLKEFAAISLLEARQLALLHVGRNEAAGFFYYVMELADDAVTGREIDPAHYVPNTLKEVRARRGRLPAAECVALGVEIARGLAGLHGRGLVHRDVKPSNIILVGGMPKLADIGLVASASAALTFVGTEGYVPPEGPGAPSADVFSLGRLLYELATGLDRHEYPRLPPDFPELRDAKALLELNEILLRACERDPSRRPRDAAVLLDDLLLLQAGKSVRRLRSAERRLARSLRVAAALVLVAGVASAGAWIQHRRAAQAETERDEIARRTVYSANLARAQRAIEHDDLGRARAFLREVIPPPGRPDLRGFEWHALWHAAQDDPHLVLRAAGPAIDRIALAPDESLFAVHDATGSLALYSLDPLREVRRLPGVGQFAGFSADGAWLLGTTAAGALSRWSARDGAGFALAARGQFRPFGAGRDRRFVALDTSARGALVVWDFLADREIRRIPLADADGEPWGLFRHAAVDPSGDAVVWAEQHGGGSSASYRVTLARLDAPLGAPLQRGDLATDRPGAVGFDRAGAWAVADPTGDVWRSREGAWEKAPEKFPIGTRKYVEAGGARYLAQGGRVLRLTSADRAPVAARAHTALLSDLAVASRHGLVFSAALDGSLYAWRQAEFGPAATTFAGWNFNAGAAGIAFSSDGASLCLPSDGQSTICLDTASLRPLWRADGMLFPVALTPRGIIGVGVAAGLALVDPRDGHRLAAPGAGGRRIRLAASAGSGRSIAAIDHAGDLVAIDADGRTRRIAGGWQRHIDLLLNRDGTRLWTSTADRELSCLAWPDGREIWRQSLAAISPKLLLLPDGRSLVVALENGHFEIRDAARGTQLRVVDAESPAPQALAVTPDGQRLFAAGIEGDIHCFETTGWRYLHSLPLHTGERLHVLVCSPDGHTLAALTKIGTLHLVRTD